MSPYEQIKRITQRATRFLAYAGMILLIPMMLLTSAEVVGRGVWSRPIPGTLELSSYMLSIFILLGVAYTHQVKGHVKVTMLTSRLPRSLAVIMDMITTLLSIFIMLVLCWQGWVKGIEERTVSDMLRIPQLPFRLLVSLAAFFLTLELLIDFIEQGRKLKEK
ncbi:MAG: TRAP transporter small permease [Desulfarculaceae bacterium]|jgi:TRAP-type C4-dicarboxylate transport system permease small subunit